MTDKELLELAAKAAGWNSWDWLAHDCVMNVYDLDGRHERFDPLNDDGDALRLAVKLKMEIGFEPDMDEIKDVVFADGNWSEPLGDNHYAATRRAIVRAAAAIGEAM